MTAVDPSRGFYGSAVETGNGISDDGMVSFGGVRVSAAEAAHFVMMHRSVVMKEVGADRTEMAQQHLEKIRFARQLLIDLGDLQEWADTDKVYKGRCPITPEMKAFLENEVNASPATYSNRLVFYGSAVPHLPESVRDYYGLDLDENGDWIKYTDRAEEFGFHWADGNNQYQLRGGSLPVILIYEDGLGELKAQVNNYIDQLNDSNNLFMTKFKNVVNNMNTALEGANNLADKTHDMMKNLVSRW